MAVQYHAFVQGVHDVIIPANVDDASQAGQATLGALTRVLYDRERHRLIDALRGS